MDTGSAALKVFLIVYSSWGVSVHSDSTPAPDMKFCEEVMKPKAVADLETHRNLGSMSTRLVWVRATCIPTRK